MDIWEAMAACEPPEKDFTLDDINTWTSNFSPMSFIARGSYGLVFHGVVSNWQEGAVKKLDISSSQVSDEDFKDQVREFLRLEHENLTRLYGYCLEEEHRILVYEYAAMGSLHDVLYGRKGVKGAEAGPVLTWAQRIRIAYGAAKGLQYLHEMVEEPIVHGEVRSSNVLLFYDFESKIGDFSLPRTMTGEVTQESDVYGFGVVVLELLTGRKAVDDTLPDDQQDLASWATPYLSADSVEQIVDHKLNGDFPQEAVAEVAAIAGLCIQDDPALRPNMSTVVEVLVALQAEPEVYDVDEIDPPVKFLSLDELNNATYSVETLEEETEASNLAESEASNLAESEAREEDFSSDYLNTATNNNEPVQEEAEASDVAEGEAALKVFSIDDLKGATDNFSQMSLVAKGSYGWVFHANFNTGELSGPAAVKKLDRSSAQDFDADFAAQVSVVSKLEHEHVTKLHGYCLEEDNRFLVYEFATRGSLHDVLHGRKGVEGAEPGHVLTWAQRAKIAYEAAKGLEYLHEKVEPPIVHGDVRSSNVLLFDGFNFGDFTAKIADFNSTKAETGEVTKKGDVYSFGVVLLELLTGRKAIDDTMPEQQQDLVTWATPHLTADNLEQIVDPKLNGDFPQSAVAKVAAMAGLCIQDEPDFRPNMSIVVKALETLVNA